MRLFKQSKSPHWWATHTVGGKRYRRSLKTKDKRKAERLAQKWAAILDEKHAHPLDEIPLEHAIEKFIQHCEQNELAHNTVRNYRHRLAFFMVFAIERSSIDVSEWDPDTALDLVVAYLNHRVQAGQVSSPKQDRLILSAFFNYLRAMRWYRGENPADSKLHLTHKPRKRRRGKRCTSPEEDHVLRADGAKTRLWPILLLTRWAGLRRGEACTVRWDEINWTEGYLDVSGHEGGRKHPRRVWLAPWLVLQLRTMRPHVLPENAMGIWPHHSDTASDDLAAFCREHLERKVGFNDLRASFVTEVFSRGMSTSAESKIVGHSPNVAEQHYSDFEGKEARQYLPPDPLRRRRPA